MKSIATTDEERGLAGLNQSGELHVVQQDGPRHLINRIAARRAALDFGAVSGEPPDRALEGWLGAGWAMAAGATKATARGA